MFCPLSPVNQIDPQFQSGIWRFNKRAPCTSRPRIEGPPPLRLWRSTILPTRRLRCSDHRRSGHRVGLGGHRVSGGDAESPRLAYDSAEIVGVGRIERHRSAYRSPIPGVNSFCCLPSWSSTIFEYYCPSLRACRLSSRSGVALRYHPPRTSIVSRYGYVRPSRVQVISTPVFGFGSRTTQTFDRC